MWVAPSIHLRKIEFLQYYSNDAVRTTHCALLWGLRIRIYGPMYIVYCFCVTGCEIGDGLTRLCKDFLVFFLSFLLSVLPSLTLLPTGGADKSLARPDWRNNWKVAIFRPTRRSLLPRRPGWTENFLNLCVYLWLAKVSLVAVAFSLPGRDKDLSASWY